MKIPEQFTTVPNPYPAPIYHQREGRPRLYINPEYRKYVAKRDRKSGASRPQGPGVKGAITRVCRVCDQKFPTTSETEQTCGQPECIKAIPTIPELAKDSGMEKCVECGTWFRPNTSGMTCSTTCREGRRERKRAASSRYRQLRPLIYGWDWEDHSVMAQLSQDIANDVASGKCEVCRQVTYFAPSRGNALSCSAEHEEIRRLQLQAAKNEARNRRVESLPRRGLSEYSRANG